jgi:uncharacterized membrane protein
MTLLVVGLLLFAILHAVPAFPEVRAGVKGRLGSLYGPAYGLASLVVLVFIVWAFRNSSRDEIYDPPNWGRHANFALTLVGFLCLGMFLFRGSLRNKLRYPMLLATLFWAAGHLLANGDAASLLLFGGMGLLGIVYAWHKSKYRGFVASEVRQGHDVLSLLAGIALYALAAQLHGAVIGVPIIQLVGL